METVAPSSNIEEHPLSGKVWLDARVWARPTGVNRTTGAILGCSIATEGPALGHGIHLDGEFVQRLAELGNAQKGGLKARFGHPNMCSTALGTFLGRWKSFSVQGNHAVADIYLSNSAKKTPNGDLHEYVMALAEKDADMFGVSIVFTAGKAYKRDNAGAKVYHPADDDTPGDDEEMKRRRKCYSDTAGPVYVELDELHSADVVDEPAANPNGLFSRWSNETLAGQVTQFLDTHPEVLELLSDHPDVVADFQTKYEAHLRRKQGVAQMADEAPAVAAQSEAAVIPETQPAAVAEPPVALSESAAPPAAAPPVDVPPAVEQPEPPQTFNADEFARICDRFGAEAAAKAVREHGNYHTACEAAYDEALKRIEKLEAQLAAKEAGGKPAGFVPRDDGAKKTEFKDLFESKTKK